MAINFGTAFAGVGSGLKNLITAKPQAEAMIQNAALKGSQQRDLDWNHARAEEAYNGIRDTYKAMGLSDAQIASMANLDTKQAMNLINNQTYARNMPMMQRYFQMANGVATPEGVVQATQSLHGGEVAPDGLIAPYKDVPVNSIAQQSAQNIARSAATLDDLASANSKILGHNQYGSVDQYGYQPNQLIGGATQVDAQRTADQHAYKQAQTANANARTARTQQLAAGGGTRKVGRKSKGNGSGGNGTGKLSNLRYLKDEQTGNYFLAGQDKKGKWQWARSASGGFMNQKDDAGGRGGAGKGGSSDIY